MTLSRELLWTFALIILLTTVNVLLPPFAGKDIFYWILFVSTFGAFFYWQNKVQRAALAAHNTTNHKDIPVSFNKFPLAQHDLSFLKKQRNGKLTSLIIVFSIPFCIFLVASHFFLPLLLDGPGTMLAWVLTLLILGVTIFFFYKKLTAYNLQIREGKKTVIIGYVSSKNFYDINDYKYTLQVESYSIIVKWPLFEKYAKGDAVEVHLFEPWNNTLLFIRKL